MNMLNYYREMFNTKKLQDEQAIKRTVVTNNSGSKRESRQQEV